MWKSGCCSVEEWVLHCGSVSEVAWTGNLVKRGLRSFVYSNQFAASAEISEQYLIQLRRD